MSTRVLLIPTRKDPVSRGGILMPNIDRYAYDQYEWQIHSCGSAVPAEIQPGQRVIVDPTSLTQRDFEHLGQKFKSVPWSELQMVVGVQSE